MSNIKNSSFFDFDEKDKHIILSESELFDIIDRSENFVNNNIDKNLDKNINLNDNILDDNISEEIKNDKKDDKKYKNIIAEEIDTMHIKNDTSINLENNIDILLDEEEDDEVIEISINELFEYYEKKKKLHYFIKENEIQQNIQIKPEEDSQRNQILDKLTEIKTKDITENILQENENIISDEMEILNNNEIEENYEDENYIDEVDNKNEEMKITDETNLETLKSEIKEVLNYIDNLLDALPEEKIKEFANSKYFSLYKKLLKEL